MPGSGLVVLIDDDRIADIHRLYELFGRPGVPEGLEVLKLGIKKTIQARGVSVNAAVLGGDGAEKPPSNAQDGDAETGKTKRPFLTGAAAVAAALRWVQEVVDLKDKFDRILKEALDENKGIQMAMNEVSAMLIRNQILVVDANRCLLQAFQTFINQNPRCQEFISLFIDENLKKGLKGVSLYPVPADFDDCTKDISLVENGRRG